MKNLANNNNTNTNNTNTNTVKYHCYFVEIVSDKAKVAPNGYVKGLKSHMVNGLLPKAEAEKQINAKVQEFKKLLKSGQHIVVLHYFKFDDDSKKFEHIQETVKPKPEKKVSNSDKLTALEKENAELREMVLQNAKDLAELLALLKK